MDQQGLRARCLAACSKKGEEAMAQRQGQGSTSATLGIGLLLIIASGVLGGLRTPLAAEDPKHGGTLTVGLAADIANFDVFRTLGYEAVWALENIHSGLVRVDANGNTVPDMATSWDISDEGRTYIFHLHKGMTFHDGTPADAEGIQWNIDYILDPANKADARVFFRPIAAAEAVDETTSQIRLKEPSADFLMVLAGYCTGFLVASPTAVKQWGQDYIFYPVGAGPFKFVQWTPGQEAILEKNKSHFKPGLPYLDKIVLKTMKEATTRIGAVRSGELAFATWIPLEMVRLLEGAPGVKVATGPMYNVWDLRINVRSQPFDDIRVRKAVAGYGPGHPLTFTLLDPTIEPAFTSVPTLLKDQMARIGVQMKIEMLDKVTWMERFIRQHEYQVTMGNPTGFAIGAFAPFFETTSPVDFSTHTDTTVDELFQRWRTITDPEEHTQATEQLQTYLADKLYQTGLANTLFFHGVREDVKGYLFVDKLHLNFETARLER
jgi:ABC-type transport system substrate-binding protein